MIRLLPFFILFIALNYHCKGQAEQVDFDKLDSLIATTPAIALCEKNGEEDLRFFSKTPEGYSNYKQEFARRMEGAFTFNPAHHFFCDITVEVDCNGKAGNYTFGIEPRTFKPQDFEYVTQLVAFINSLAEYSFKPAYYLGENVNSKVSFRLVAKEGKATIQ